MAMDADLAVGAVAPSAPDDEGPDRVRRGRQADDHGQVPQGRDHVPGSKACVGSAPSVGAT